MQAAQDGAQNFLSFGEVNVDAPDQVVSYIGTQANPGLGFRGLFRGALSVGHDHIAATVNTLVFAYAGASLPVLLIFSIGGTTFTDAINSEAVAEEVVATLVGSIGLIASMPITTALAALLALRLGGRALAAEADHAHAH